MTSKDSILEDFRKLNQRLLSHEVASNRLFDSAEDNLRWIGETQNELNSVEFSKRRNQIVLDLQKEKHQISELLQQNNELWAALEDHKKAIKLYLTKNQQKFACIAHTSITHPADTEHNSNERPTILSPALRKSSRMRKRTQFYVEGF
ncbi:FGFR1 oncogene partner 2 -like protein [Caligus rogercresseyi]|uniref:FGFR1 oncogene partner 2 -like protein n=1 Tax=Caligus rogercresseyi TaxID=217165 RepID=A0A7T8HKQ8_CALRO|nr:FGFR1 oncogene partner 2 -like protein [Caligus rogercresseyi]